MLYDPKWEIELDNDVVAILKNAKALIENKSRWTKGEYARAASGGFVPDPLCERAERFCSIGALARVTGAAVSDVEHGACPAFNYLITAAQDLGFDHVTSCNDRSDHAGTMAMFDRAIELAGA